MARGLRRPTPHTPPALWASYLFKEACFQATPNPRPAMSAQESSAACLGPAAHRLYLGCWQGARGGLGSAALFLCGRASILCVFSADTTGQQRATAETKQTSKHTPASIEWGFSDPACSALPRAAHVGSSGGGGDLDVGSPAAPRLKRRKGNQQGLGIRPSRAEQQEQRFGGTVDTVAAHLQGPPLRRNAPAGDRAVAVHRRPRDETTQMPRSPPSMTRQWC